MNRECQHQLKACYPYFGGKSKIANEVWQRFGVTDRYIEPFFGSGAVLLANPNWRNTKEIVNDLNHYIANFWRAVQAEPEAVAYYCDYPTIETDLHARHLWLVNEGAEIIKRCASDDTFYDVKAAGWWVWGMANWIGSHFAAGTGGWTREKLALAEELNTYDLREINRKLPHLSGGQGINRQLPHLSGGQGINRQLPHLSGGRGINRKLGDRDVSGSASTVEFEFPKNHGLYQYINRLAERMIEVDVCCGDWERILKPAVTLAGEQTTSKGTASIFLDPPYSAEAGRASVYTHEDFSVAHAVRKWCIEHGDNPQMRIALCGYDLEHKELEEHGWLAWSWSANGGYSTFANKDNVSHANKHREVIWFSPHCVRLNAQEALF